MNSSRSLLMALTVAGLLPVVGAQSVHTSPIIAQLVPPMVVAPKAVPPPTVPAPPATKGAYESSIYAHVLLYFGMAAEDDGKLLEAAEIYKNVISVTREFEYPSMDYAVAAGRLAGVHAQLAHWQLSKKFAQYSLDEFIRLEGVHSNDAAVQLNNIGQASKQMGNWVEAETAFKRALTAATSSCEIDDSLIGVIERSYAELLCAVNRYDEAAAHYRSSYTHFKQYFGHDHPVTKLIEKDLRKTEKQVRSNRIIRH